jgi:hypothetical protein
MRTTKRVLTLSLVMLAVAAIGACANSPKSDVVAAKNDTSESVPPPGTLLDSPLGDVPEVNLQTGDSAAGQWELVASSGLMEEGQLCVLISFDDGGQGGLCGQPDELPALSHGVVVPADQSTSFIVGIVSAKASELVVESPDRRSPLDIVANSMFPGVRFFMWEAGVPTDESVRLEAIDSSGGVVASDELTVRAGPPAS